jgi:flagellar assembly protein FliH
MATAAVKLQIPMAVGSIQILDPKADMSSAAADSRQTAELKNKFSRLGEAMNKAVEQIDAYGQNLFAIHRDKIVHLAVQIAARILARQIQDGQYAMENILVQAIEHAPPGQAIEVHLNPDDLKTCETWLKDQQAGLSREIKLTADWSVQRAECVVHTPDGIMEYRIEEHLRQIEAAMIKQNSTAESKTQKDTTV